MASGLTQNEKLQLKEQAKAEKLQQIEEAKAERIKQAEQTWLNNHPGLYDGDDFTFSKIKDLDLENYENPNKSTSYTIKTVTQKPQFIYPFTANTLEAKLTGSTTTNYPFMSINNINSNTTPKNFSALTQDRKSKTIIPPRTTDNNIIKSSINNTLTLSPPATIFTAGTVDLSFPNGVNYGFDNDVYVIKKLNDGSILVGGAFGSYDYNGSSYYSPGLINLNANGTPNENFGVLNYGGNGFNGAVYTIDVQSDGKIIVGGNFIIYDIDGTSFTGGFIIRLTNDGYIDLDFYIGNAFDELTKTIKVLSDDKILVGGNFTNFNGTSITGICRLNSNGSIDSSFLVGNFVSNGSGEGIVNTIAIQSDGKILVGGDFESYSGQNYNNIIRLNTDGSIDTSFVVGNGFYLDCFYSWVNDIALQSDGKIIVGGTFGAYNNNPVSWTPCNGNIVRLNSNGSFNSKFEYGFDDSVNKIYVQSDDKIIVGGWMNILYTSFDGLPINIDELIRFNADCTLDYSFYYEELFNSGVYAIELESDGKILVGGDFNESQGDDPRFILNYFGRLNNVIQEYPYVYLGYTDWCTDGPGTYITVGSAVPPVLSIGGPENVYSFDVLSNPSQTKIGLAMPGSTEFIGYPTNVIELVQKNDYGRNNCYDAIRDNSMVANCEDVFEGVPNRYEILVDKKYNLNDIGFYQTVFEKGEIQYFFHSTFKIIDLTEFDNNSILPTEILPYMPYESAEDSVRANGQYVYMDDCVNGNGSAIFTKQFDIVPYGVEKYFSMLDEDSPCKVGVEVLSYFEDDFDVEIFNSLTGGTTPLINSTLTYNNCFECLNKSAFFGVQNVNFYDGGFNGDNVYVTVEQPDGKILVGGYFDEYDGTTVNSFMRLNSDGSLDTTFNVGGSGLNGLVRAIALQPDGKIIVGGDFDTYNDEYAGYIIRLNPDGSIDNSFTYLSEFNNIVRAIVIQNDGKIVVGGGFTSYGDYDCNRIVRLNSDGTPDTTFEINNGFDGQIFVIKLEENRIIPFYNANNPITYDRKYIVGGSFESFNGNNTNLITMINEDGSYSDEFNGGFNQGNRVVTIEKQTDGKLLIGGYFQEYNNNATPYNIVRLNTNYTIDNSFIGLPYTEGGGFNDGWVLSIKELPNGKIMVGSRGEYFGDLSDNNHYTGYLVKLTSEGQLDTTFTFTITDGQVNHVSLLSNGTLLVGGWFESPTSLLLNLFIGEENLPYSFETCEGQTTNIYLPEGYTIKYSGTGSEVNINSIEYSEISTSGLELAVDGNYDDDYWTIEFPTGFNINFLDVNYTSINISSNPYITFGNPNIGDTADDCCFDIPNEIPTSTEQPGVYISFQCPNTPGDFDGELNQLYTGLTDGGNTLVFKYYGTDYCDKIATLIYGFKFYKNNPNYFDLIIEDNTDFFNDDPTGGTSDGVNPTWLATFDSSPLNAYRISAKKPLPIKANINTSDVVCGTIGNVIYTAETTTIGTLGGSMYFDGVNNTMVQVDNSGGQFGFNGGNDFTIEWFQYFTGIAPARPFSIGVYDNPNEMIGMSFEGTVYLWINNNAENTTITNDDLLNNWHHIAITRNFNGGDSTWRVFLDGVQKTSFINNTDTTNTYTLTIGNQLNNDGKFEGYITNFRVNNISAIYTSNFDVPTAPLENGPNIILLMLSTNSAGLITDTTNTQSISQTGVTWSDETPFLSSRNIFYTVTSENTYDDCASCTATTVYNATLLVRDGINAPYINRVTISPENINRIQTYGPIFTESMGGIHGLNVYELLGYSL